MQSLLMNAAVDLLPDFAREMHGLSRPLLSPLVRGGTYGIARTIRWAFAGERYRRADDCHSFAVFSRACQSGMDFERRLEDVVDR